MKPDESVWVKLHKLEDLLKEMNSLLVAFSGGVDSSLLIRVAHQTLGERVVAATARSVTYPESEIAFASQLAASLGVRHIVLETHELENAAFAANPPDRCYLCKGELFARLQELAKTYGCAYVADGANVDDLGDFRPGRKAAREYGVRSPLQEAGLTKADIRELSRSFGLPNWNKPSLACLSSRFPYGQQITPAKLRQVENAENVLREYGIQQCRVRHHGSLARLEVEGSDLQVVLTNRLEIAEKIKKLGFTYVTMDLLGYRTGSMNESLDENVKLRAVT